MRVFLAPRRAVLTFALALAMIVMGMTVPSTAAPASAFVRVNQVGYPAGFVKRAYLMSSAAETGATFAVKNAAGRRLFSGADRPGLGSWSNAYPFVYALDFAAVTSPGTYSIEVTGPVAATSPTFTIDSGAGRLLAGARQRAVLLPDRARRPELHPERLRTAPAHLNDQNAMTYLTPHVNSSGRFSGDLTPLGNPDRRVGRLVGRGRLHQGRPDARLHDGHAARRRSRLPGPDGRRLGDVELHRGGEVRHGLAARMWDDATRTFYYQVGIGTGNAKTVGDHDIWRLPQADDTFGGTDPLYRYIRNRPVFRAGPPGSLISPNLAGRDRGRLRPLLPDLPDRAIPAFANAVCSSGQHIFDLADTNPRATCSRYLPFSFYPETEWRSDLELGAVELYLAMASGDLPAGLPHADPSFYLQQAAHWANAYITGPDDAADTLNLYDVSGLAHYELHKAIGQAGNPAGLETTQAALVADLKKALDGAIAQAATDPFQFGFPWATWDTTSHGAGLSVMASEYDAAHRDRATHAAWSGAGWRTSSARTRGGFVRSSATAPRSRTASTTRSRTSSARSTARRPSSRARRSRARTAPIYAGFQTGMRNCPPDDSDPFAAFNSGRPSSGTTSSRSRPSSRRST